MLAFTVTEIESARRAFPTVVGEFGNVAEKRLEGQLDALYMLLVVVPLGGLCGEACIVHFLRG